MAVMASLIKALLQGSSTVLLLLSVSCGTEYDKGWAWGSGDGRWNGIY